MAALTIPPIRLGLIGLGLAVEKLHWPASCGLAGAVSGSTGPPDGLPGQQISSSASFAA